MFLSRLQIGLLIILCQLPITSMAVVPKWQIVPAESKLSFTATQNNAPVIGEFKAFQGEINFDPNNLNESNIKIVVDMTSVYTSYSEVSTTLKTSDWFDVAKFPSAFFKANNFTKNADNTYAVNGPLTIRDKTIPVTLFFVLEEYSATKARAKGSVNLQRTLFGVGRGEWAQTDSIKDIVQVNFVLSAVKK